MEYEIEDRPQMGEDCEYEYVIARTEWRVGTLPPRFAAVPAFDRAVQIPEQELLA